MTCQIKVLSHACVLVKSETHSIIVDPWLIGSCYWRSWWNFPESVYDESELVNIDAVVISHIHWDHWHGPTLKKFFKNKKVIISDDPNDRSYDDLKSIKFTDIERIKHGKSIEIGDIKITFYHFGLFLTDVAMVIEVGGTTILNANDAKVAGNSLDYIINKHKPIDFALRSHSSANARICFKILSNDHYKHDDRDHYFRSFKLFMDKVKPKYAIPFASNHCHLNQDVFHFNDYISDPLELANWTNKYENEWDTKVMLPGSHWCSKKGFTMVSDRPFLNKKETLKEYKDKVQDRLDFYNKKELKVDVDDRLLDRFKSFIKLAGVKKLKIKIRFLLTSPNNLNNQSILISDGDIQIDKELSPTPRKDEALIIMPKIVFRDSVIKNMFSHAYISKRCEFIAHNEKHMNILKYFLTKIENFELIVKPIKSIYLLRVFIGYCLRWREVIVYLKALYLQKTEGLELYEIEERLLK